MVVVKVMMVMVVIKMAVTIADRGESSGYKSKGGGSAGGVGGLDDGDGNE